MTCQLAANMSDPTSTPIAIPSPALDRAMSPDPEGYRPINPSSSPSFDYHQERRLHLKDEIYFSHHLPRLPPPSLTDEYPGQAAGGLSPSAPAPTALAAAGAISPSSISAAGPGSGLRGPSGSRTANVSPLASGVSPSAFHPRSLGNSIASMRDLHLGPSYQQQPPQGMPSTSSSRSATPTGDQHDMYYQSESGMEHDPESSRSTMFSPSAPEDGDLDPSRTLIHRQELDSQERLDLEEEAMERELAGPEVYNPTASAAMAAAGPGAASGSTAPAAGQANAQPRPEERECLLRSVRPSELSVRGGPSSPRHCSFTRCILDAPRPQPTRNPAPGFGEG